MKPTHAGPGSPLYAPGGGTSKRAQKEEDDRQPFPSFWSYLQNIYHWFVCGHRWCSVGQNGRRCMKCKRPRPAL